MPCPSQAPAPSAFLAPPQSHDTPSAHQLDAVIEFEFYGMGCCVELYAFLAF